MRCSATLLTLSFGAWAVAQDALETMKTDVVGSTAQANSGSGLGQLINLFVVIAVMFVLIKFGLPKMIHRLTNRMSTPLESSLKVEESATIGAGGLYVVTVRGKTLLVGGSANGSMALIADLTESDRAERQEPAFFEVLDQAAVEAEPAPTARRELAIELEEDAPVLDLEHFRSRLDARKESAPGHRLDRILRGEEA